MLYYITIINLILIVITTPSIINPGPLLLDFQSYLHLENPDIVIVNETWLNEHIIINNNEIVDEQYYKCFRLDRTALDKEKYGKVGGSGVLILVKQGLDTIVKKVNIATKLPILSIDMKF